MSLESCRLLQDNGYGILNTFCELRTEITVGCDGRSRYRTKVYYVPDKVQAVRSVRTEVVPRDNNLVLWIKS